MVDIREIINASNMSFNTFDETVNSKIILEQWFDLIYKCKEELTDLSQIDEKNTNGYTINFETVDAIKEDVLKLDDQYKKVLSMQKDTKNNFIIGKEQDSIGVICLVSDGNPYVMMEFISKSILTHNAIIIAQNTEYMKATNNLLVKLLQKELSELKIDEKVVQLIYVGEFDELLSSTTSIKKVFVSGNKELSNAIITTSKIPVRRLGYGYYDIYVEDKSNIDLVKSLLKNQASFDIYLNDDIELDFFEDAISVKDVDEAIFQINNLGTNYSSGIFTNDSENGVRFLKEIKSDFVSVNASPFVEKYDLINIKELIKEKTVYYPFAFNSDEKLEFKNNK